MKCPKDSYDGRCPSCSSDDWKLASEIVSSGTTIVDTDSEGGGWGVSAGRGQGQGGISLNYQGVNLETSGTLTTAAAITHAPPQIPNCFNEKNDRLRGCSIQISESRLDIIRIEAFASNYDAVKPGFFSTIAEGNFEIRRRTYDEDRAKLEEIRDECRNYDTNKALWDKMRVCNRCGESFVTNYDRQQTSGVGWISIPDYTFEGEHRRCPSCKSYIWKTADAFFHIRLRELQVKHDTAKHRLAESVDFANNPNDGGLLKKVWRKITTTTPEKAQEEVEQAESQLADMRQRQIAGIHQYPQPNYEKVRVCVNCENLYLLDV